MQDSVSPEATGRLPADTLRGELTAAEKSLAGEPWSNLEGGRSNRSWMIETSNGKIVCKLYDTRSSTPLFPNDDAAEYMALMWLRGTGLAPEPVRRVVTSLGTCLIYRFVAGRPWKHGAGAVGELLARLHGLKAPNGLRRLRGGSAALRAIGNAILDECPESRAGHLRRLAPGDPMVDAETPVFLHGDVVPGNIIQDAHGLTLIDWQCPAVGDPSEDLATFLSPAMQVLSGRKPLSPAQESEFLSGYDNPAVAHRFAALRPLYHWRMAAYCLWKSARGDASYEPALQLELAALGATDK